MEKVPQKYFHPVTGQEISYQEFQQIQQAREDIAKNFGGTINPSTVEKLVEGSGGALMDSSEIDEQELEAQNEK